MIIKLNNDLNPPPFTRYGGKGTTAAWYRGLLPAHHTYVETYCGSAALLFGKTRSKVEVINDLDGDIYNFFSVLRDPVQSAVLADNVAKTPYSRDEFARCRTLMREEKDPVERARMFFVLSRQCFGSIVGESWAYGRVSMKSFHTSLATFEPLCQRLQQVQVENLPALTVIEKYDTPRTCFFADPPYLHETRVSVNGYRHEMTDEDHEKLLERLKAVQGKVMLCGYPSAMYDNFLSGWRRVDRMVTSMTGALSQGNAERPARTEVVWMNYPDPRAN